MTWLSWFQEDDRRGHRYGESTRGYLAAILGVLLAAALSSARAEEPKAEAPASAEPKPAASISTKELRAAVDRALPLITLSARKYTEERQCFSCHHQALSVMALTAARKAGWQIDAAELEHQIAHTRAFLQNNEEGYRAGRGQGGQADTAGYALWMLAHAGQEPDELTAAICHYLLERHSDRDYWQPTSNRPPTEASPFTTTYLALQALEKYATTAQQARYQARRQQVLDWLQRISAVETEDRVFRLRAFALTGTSDQRDQAASELVGGQNADGSWSQRASMDGDAYATGTALATLLETGVRKASDECCQKAAAWLMARQQEDGSWHVVTRSEPIQVYFETGFPHGEDQFISMAATCWSSMALTHMLGNAAP